jgi:hypothetical protein
MGAFDNGGEAKPIFLMPTNEQVGKYPFSGFKKTVCFANCPMLASDKNQFLYCAIVEIKNVKSIKIIQKI